jgi:ComEC/Rec2-related protein
MAFLSYLAGILLTGVASISFNLVYLLGGVCLALGLFFITRKISYFLLCGTFFILGITAGIKGLENNNILENYKRKKIDHITVEVRSIPARVEDKFVFKGVIWNKNATVKIYAPWNDEIKPGDIVQLQGKFRKTPAGVNFSASGFRIISSDFSFLKFIYDLKIRLSEKIDSLYPPNFSGFIKAITLGERDSLSPIRYNIQKAGLAHILAISGLHVGLILFFFHFLFKNLGIRRKARSLILISISLLYLFLTSGRPPVMRATIMALIYLYFSLFYMRVNVFNLILLAGFLILLLEPFAIYEASFQLSFVAVVGICLMLKLFPPAQQYSIKNRAITYLKVIFSAWLFTSPLIWFYWRRFMVLQLPVIFFLLPIFTLILGIGFCALLFSLFVFPVAKFFAVSSYPFLFLFLNATKLISNWRYSWIKLPSANWEAVFIVYIILLGAMGGISVIIRKKMGGVKCLE